MFPLLSVSQLMDSVLTEQQSYAIQDPKTPPKVPTENTNTPEWIEAETGAGGMPTKDTSGLTWQETGLLVAGLGGATAAVGAIFDARAEQSRLKTQQLSLQHDSSMAAINARQAEVEAQDYLRSGQRDIGEVTLRAGAEASARRATMAGRGVQLGVGSAAEVQASGELVKEMDVMAIGSNAARGAAAARVAGVNQRNRSMFSALSARNARRNAGNDLLPAAAAGTSLLFSGSRLGAQWATDRNRYRS